MVVTNPYNSFQFTFEIQGLSAGGFSEVSGLGAETRLTEEVWAGGVNDFLYQFPKATTYPLLELKHGLSDVTELWGWYKNVIEGKIQRKNCTLFLLGHDGGHKRSWSFNKALPVKWAGPAFNALQGPIATESFTLQHQGLSLGK